MFPGRFGGHFLPDSADKALRKVCKQVGLIGVSSHSFRQFPRKPLRKFKLYRRKKHRGLQLSEKIDLQIIYALKAKRGNSLFTKVPALRNAAITDDKGRIKVVIHTRPPCRRDR
ncbi:hypothetical protein H6F96_14510 [Microcoleus sp. FACHB-53]|nr:hypothetical protein [Microcoleus sp. FACHB-53]